MANRYQQRQMERDRAAGAARKQEREFKHLSKLLLADKYELTHRELHGTMTTCRYSQGWYVVKTGVIETRHREEALKKMLAVLEARINERDHPEYNSAEEDN